jgi:predicted MFS family arabinose efflux permease
VAERDEKGVRRRGPDPTTLLIGALSLGIAAGAFAGELPSLSGFDARWLFAAGAALAGLLLLIGSLRLRRP